MRDPSGLSVLERAQVVLDRVLRVLHLRRGRVALEAARLIDGATAGERIKRVASCWKGIGPQLNSDSI